MREDAPSRFRDQPSWHLRSRSKCQIASNTRPIATMTAANHSNITASSTNDKDSDTPARQQEFHKSTNRHFVFNCLYIRGLATVEKGKDRNKGKDYEALPCTSETPSYATMSFLMLCRLTRRPMRDSTSGKSEI